jgi:hypothetical protein
MAAPLATCTKEEQRSVIRFLPLYPLKEGPPVYSKMDPSIGIKAKEGGKTNMYCISSLTFFKKSNFQRWLPIRQQFCGINSNLT